MKSMMSIDKSQITTDYFKWTYPDYQYYTTNPRTALIQAGYVKYAVIMVGGSGGCSTDHSSLSGGQYGAGGGGGGSLRREGPLSDLPEISSIKVGARGADSNVFCTGGGSSNFNNWSAYGGQGAGIVPEGQNHAQPSQGGNGGGNSLNLGSGGAGGHARGISNGVDIPYNPPDTGNSVDQGGGNVGGYGGGGGAGRSYDPGHSSGVTGGANGSYPAMGAAGAAPRGDYGGCGGGANVGSVTGVSEVYGTWSGGCVALRYYHRNG